MVIAVFTRAYHLFLLWARWFLQYAVIISLYTTYQSLWFIFEAYYIDECQVLKRWRFFHVSSWGPHSLADGRRKEKVYKSWYERGCIWHFWYTKIWRIKRRVTEIICFVFLLFKLSCHLFCMYFSCTLKYYSLLSVVMHINLPDFSYSIVSTFGKSVQLMMLYNLWMEVPF